MKTNQLIWFLIKNRVKYGNIEIQVMNGIDVHLVKAIKISSPGSIISNCTFTMENPQRPENEG